MAKKAKKAAGRAPTKSQKTKKAIAVKSTKAPKKSAAKKPAAKKAARRSTADVAKLRKSVIAGSKAKKTADPDTLHWGHVGNLEFYASQIRRVTDAAFREGEHAE